MSNKTQRDLRKKRNERKAIKAIHRRDRQSLLESKLRQPPASPSLPRSPVDKLDAILSGSRTGRDPVTSSLEKLTRRSRARQEPMSRLSDLIAPRNRVAKLRELLTITQRKLPALMTPSGLGILWRLTDVSWVRPLSAWKARGRIISTRLRSLLRHLLLKYPAPNFLLTELSGMAEEEVAAFILDTRLALLVSLGRGDSPRTAQRDGLLPAVLTKRMLHRLLQTPASTLVHAVRVTQVVTFGGSTAMATQVCASTLGSSLQADAPFWQGIIQWLCAQPMLNPRQVRPMLDYIRNQHGMAAAGGRASWSIKGRTADSLIRDMEQWHARLHQIRQIRDQTFLASGFSGGCFELKSKGSMTIWAVTEISNQKTLAAEGRALRHCVFSYRDAIQKGRSSIWSMTCNSDRVLTIEVENQRGHIIQVRGRSNRRPNQQERGILARWATTARLTLKTGAML
ncbi:MAG: hypothetical protein ACI8RZ_005613 [Myxococcota bacterium]|jgi:hypothetical protein